MGLVTALAGAGGGHDDEAGLVAVLGGRRAGDDFERLDGVGRDLIREDLALLVGDGLAIDGEGIGGVIAQAVEQAVGIGGDAGGGSGDERAERGGWLSSGTFAEQVAVDVGVEGGIGLDEIAVGSTVMVCELAATWSVSWRLVPTTERTSRLWLSELNPLAEISRW